MIAANFYSEVLAVVGKLNFWDALAMQHLK